MTIDGGVARLTVGETTYDLEQQRSPILIGRALPARVLIEHPLVSRHHAELVYDGGWSVRDLGSTNGTFSGGVRVQSADLRAGGEVRLGDPTTGVVLVVEPAGAPVPPPLDTHTSRRSVARRPTGDRKLVGRDPRADVHVNDPVASWHHAELVRTGPETWAIVDLGSTNQTLVNGVPVASHHLAPGDFVLVGNTRLTWDGRTLGPVPESESGFVVDGASWDVKGKRIVSSISFTMRTASLVAVIGPSGAGKSTLMRLITGQTRPSQGTVSLDGASLASQRAAHRGQIGVVPQYTVAHQSLTARQVLSNAARLRLPPDTQRHELAAAVAASLEQLGLTEHADTRMSRLSGGQQRRVGIAMEMLTNPTLLILDEPTAGLDPSLVLQIMQTLRRLADSGTKVVLVTHDLDHLALADQVVVLRAGGTLAYSGPPGGVFGHFGTRTWAETFTRLAVPDHSGAAPFPPAHGSQADPVELPVPPASLSTVVRHFSVVAFRQVRLMATDAGYLLLMVAMPVALALLTLAIPGEDGLSPSDDPTSAEASRLLVILIVGAAFLGLSATVRDLVSERPIFAHERDAGLVPSAYLFAKLVVFTGIAVFQAVLLTGLVLASREPPEAPVLLPWASLEIAVAVALTAMTGVALGLAVSARVRTSEQAMPPLVLLVMAQLVLCGGMFPVDEGKVLPVLSGLIPTRSGYAMAASTTNLNEVSAAIDSDSMWAHTASSWFGSALILVAMWGTFSLLAFISVRRRAAV